MSEIIPTVGRSRETAIRRDALGRWFNRDVPITHPKLVRAFDRWLDRAENGRYILRNEINWAYVEVDGPALFVRRVESTEDGVILQLSNGSKGILRLETLRQGPDGALYCSHGGWSARFDRQAVHQFADLLGEDDQGVYVEVAGERTRVPVVECPLEPSPSE